MGLVVLRLIIVIVVVWYIFKGDEIVNCSVVFIKLLGLNYVWVFDKGWVVVGLLIWISGDNKVVV